MKNRLTIKFVAIAFLFGMAAFVTSCKKDSDPISGSVSQTVSNESTQDSQQDEVDDMSTAQLNSSDPSGGRVMTGSDGRTACAFITWAPGAEKMSGSLTIEFDKTATGDANANGCTDARGNVRKGTIQVTWTGGRWFNPGSAIVITLTNYSINGVVLNGTRTLTNITSQSTPLIPTWTIVSSINVTWADTKTSSRTVHKTRAWDILAGTVTVTQTDSGTSAASGTTQNGVDYAVAISQPLVYKLSCIGTSKVYIAVSGTKVITFDNKTVTVDFGTGTCDDSFTVTYNGKTDTFSGTN